MQSQNFEFLRPRWEELTELGALAETHAHVDPSSAAVKLRAFAEQVVLFIYHQHGIPSVRHTNLNDLLAGTSFRMPCSFVTNSRKISTDSTHDRQERGRFFSITRLAKVPGRFDHGHFDGEDGDTLVFRSAT
jgi:hypothetical protein